MKLVNFSKILFLKRSQIIVKKKRAGSQIKIGKPANKIVTTIYEKFGYKNLEKHRLNFWTSVQLRKEIWFFVRSHSNKKMKNFYWILLLDTFIFSKTCTKLQELISKTNVYGKEDFFFNVGNPEILSADSVIDIFKYFTLSRGIWFWLCI